MMPVMGKFCVMVERCLSWVLNNDRRNVIPKTSNQGIFSKSSKLTEGFNMTLRKQNDRDVLPLNTFGEVRLNTAGNDYRINHFDNETMAQKQYPTNNYISTTASNR